MRTITPPVLLRLLCLVLTLSCLTTSLRAGEEGKNRAAQRGKAKQRELSSEQKRALLKSMVSTRVKNAVQRKEALERINNLEPSQVDELFAMYQQRLRQASARDLDQANRDLRQAQAYRAQLQRQLAARRGGNVGFAPVITWLPQGTTFQAGAVISPDRRSVRVNALPFYSSIGNVNTFTFNGPRPVPLNQPQVRRPGLTPPTVPPLGQPRIRPARDVGIGRIFGR